MYNNLQSYLQFLNSEPSDLYFSAIFTFVSRPICVFSLPPTEILSSLALGVLQKFAMLPFAAAQKKRGGEDVKKEKQNTLCAEKIHFQTENFNKD